MRRDGHPANRGEQAKAEGCQSRAAIALHRRQPVDDSFEVGFYVFDLASAEPFSRRWDRRSALVGQIDCDHVKLVPGIRAKNAAVADALHRLNLKANFEGTIYRIGDGGLPLWPHSSSLLKRKPNPGSGFKTDRQFTRSTDLWKP